MKNLQIISSTLKEDIINELKKSVPTGAHFTNGTYAYDKSLVVPTTLAGFKRVMQVWPHLPLVIAVNSNQSMAEIGQVDFEDEIERAQKVAEPLAEVFVGQPIIAIFYDEKTPKELYEKLAAHGLTRTLHKWGYGTSLAAPKIEGAEFFEMVYGFPMPNDIKPVCYDQTAIAEEPQQIIVDDLRDVLINSHNKVLFELPETLNEFQAETIKETKLSI